MPGQRVVAAVAAVGVLAPAPTRARQCMDTAQEGRHGDLARGERDARLQALPNVLCSEGSTYSLPRQLCFGGGHSSDIGAELQLSN